MQAKAAAAYGSRYRHIQLNVNVQTNHTCLRFMGITLSYITSITVFDNVSPKCQ
jgi:hypothetical protein